MTANENTIITIDMKDLHLIIADNLAALRKSSGLTQAQVAERLSYSDKAVSRWERGDTMPDINVLYELCAFYGITLDMLTQRGGVSDKGELPMRESKLYRIAFNALNIAVVWLIATVLFVYRNVSGIENAWTLFIWAIPCSSLSLMLANRRYYRKEPILYFILYSILTWTLLTSVYVQFLQLHFGLIYIVGIPVQIALILWLIIRRTK